MRPEFSKELDLYANYERRRCRLLIRDVVARVGNTPRCVRLKIRGRRDRGGRYYLIVAVLYDPTVPFALQYVPRFIETLRILSSGHRDALHFPAIDRGIKREFPRQATGNQ